MRARLLRASSGLQMILSGPDLDPAPTLDGGACGRGWHHDSGHAA